MINCIFSILSWNIISYNRISYNKIYNIKNEKVNVFKIIYIDDDVKKIRELFCSKSVVNQ